MRSRWFLGFGCWLWLAACDGAPGTAGDAAAPDETAALDAVGDAPRDALAEIGGADAPGPDARDAGGEVGPAPRACNGHAALCGRRFNAVAYVTTHNAMSSAENGWPGPNQYEAVPQQLLDGVRALMLDTHDEDGELLLCHGYCVFGSQPLVEGLAEIRTFLDGAPHEVVSLIFEAYIDADATAAAFAESGLLAYVHAHDPDAPWPTLGELIDRGERLVVFTDLDGGILPWYLDVWQYAFETPFDVARADEFSCSTNRGSPDSDLFILNHFVTDLVASETAAAEVNANPFLIERARQCQAELQHLPNFVTVDFYSLGDVFAAVDALNGVAGAPFEEGR